MAILYADPIAAGLARSGPPAFPFRRRVFLARPARQRRILGVPLSENRRRARLRRAGFTLLLPGADMEYGEEVRRQRDYVLVPPSPA
jgi:hypothetical protein